MFKTLEDKLAVTMLVFWFFGLGIIGKSIASQASKVDRFTELAQMFNDKISFCNNGIVFDKEIIKKAVYSSLYSMTGNKLFLFTLLLFITGPLFLGIGFGSEDFKKLNKKKKCPACPSAAPSAIE